MFNNCFALSGLLKVQVLLILFFDTLLHMTHLLTFSVSSCCFKERREIWDNPEVDGFVQIVASFFFCYLYFSSSYFFLTYIRRQAILMPTKYLLTKILIIQRFKFFSHNVLATKSSFLYREICLCFRLLNYIIKIVTKNTC